MWLGISDRCVSFTTAATSPVPRSFLSAFLPVSKATLLLYFLWAVSTSYSMSMCLSIFRRCSPAGFGFYLSLPCPRCLPGPTIGCVAQTMPIVVLPFL